MTPAHPRWRSIGAKACLLVVVAAALAAACNSILAIKDPTLEDAGGGSDARPIDSAIDGPPAVCTTGACCSPTGQFEPATKVCSTVNEFQCTASCAGHPQQRTLQTFCSGNSASCDGQMMTGAFADLGAPCTADQICETQQGGLAPRCTGCGFGCDPGQNACRPAKLWVYETTGAVLGNAFQTPTVREGADGLCRDTFTATFSARACNPNHVHAILFVSPTDSLTQMASRFNIPTTVPVNRAADDASVATNWVVMLDPNNSLAGPPTDAPTVRDPDGLLWIGDSSTVGSCRNWTSGQMADSALRGNGTLKTPNWQSDGFFRCDRTNHLLCVCWSGP